MESVMAEIFSPFAKALALPPMSLFVAIGIGWMLRRRWPRAGGALILAGLGLLYLLSTPLVARELLRSLESDPVPDLARAREAGAIVVLGADLSSEAPEYGGFSVGALTLERMRYAARLHRQTGLPVLVSA